MRHSLLKSSHILSLSVDHDLNHEPMGTFHVQTVTVFVVSMLIFSYLYEILFLLLLHVAASWVSLQLVLLTEHNTLCMANLSHVQPSNLFIQKFAKAYLTSILCLGFKPISMLKTLLNDSWISLVSSS